MPQRPEGKRFSYSGGSRMAGGCSATTADALLDVLAGPVVRNLARHPPIDDAVAGKIASDRAEIRPEADIIAGARPRCAAGVEHHARDFLDRHGAEGLRIEKVQHVGADIALVGSIRGSRSGVGNA